MRRAVHRYELKSNAWTLSMPAKANVVDAVYSSERKAFSVYAEIDLDETMTIERRFGILATGQTHDYPWPIKHIRSIIMPDGFHVFHVFEVTANDSMEWPK